MCIRDRAAAGNIPGAREYPATWIDSSGNLWLFGGYGNVSSNNVYFNDLWEYSQSTGEWTWVSGSSSTNVTGVYAVSYTHLDVYKRQGYLSIPYTASTDDNVIGTLSPSGQINAVIGAGSQAVSVTFDTDDGNAASGLAITSNLSALPPGWSSSAGAFSCASVSTGNSCQLGLTYAPSAVGSGTLSLAFSYIDNTGNAKSGTVSIPYAASTHDNVIASPSPSGQIAVAVNASAALTVTFDTDDGNLATNLAITCLLYTSRCV